MFFLFLILVAMSAVVLLGVVLTVPFLPLVGMYYALSPSKKIERKENGRSGENW